MVYKNLKDRGFPGASTNPKNALEVVTRPTYHVTNPKAPIKDIYTSWHEIKSSLRSILLKRKLEKIPYKNIYIRAYSVWIFVEHLKDDIQLQRTVPVIQI